MSESDRYVFFSCYCIKICYNPKQLIGMKVCVLGAGNVAGHLIEAFGAVGCHISVWNHAEESLRLLRRNGCTFFCTTDMKKLPIDADIYIISVKDNAVCEVAKDLSVAMPDIKKTVVHTAGSLSADILKPYFDLYGVMYPMQTFSKTKALDYSKIPFFIEGSETVLSLLRELLLPISKNLFVLEGNKRRVLHLASVFACNFVNHNIAIAFSLLDTIDVPHSMLIPLISETLDKLNYCTPIDGQTGPAVREDYNVMASHMEMLDGFPLLKQIYQLESESIVEFKHKHLKNS